MWGLGSGVQGLGFGFWGLEFGVWDLGFERLLERGLRLGFRVQG